MKGRSKSLKVREKETGGVQIKYLIATRSLHGREWINKGGRKNKKCKHR